MNQATEDRLARHLAEKAAPSMNGLADSALGGVTVSFLAQVFRMDNAAVKRKLVNLKPMDSRTRGTTQVQHLYDLAEAAAYLVEPKVDPVEMIRAMKQEDMPPSINATYWQAQLARQKWEENARELWRTSKIREVLGGTFQTIKFTIQLWEDTLERQTGITEEQRTVLMGLTDGLQTEIYTALVRNKDVSSTGPQIAELPQMLKEEDDLDDDAAALI